MYNLEIFTPKTRGLDGTVIADGGETGTCTAKLFPLNCSAEGSPNREYEDGPCILGVSLL